MSGVLLHAEIEELIRAGAWDELRAVLLELDPSGLPRTTDH